jgi:hypothetical protein
MRSVTRGVLIAVATGLTGCSSAGATKLPAGAPWLDASRYRAPIVTIDRIVYDTTTITEMDRDTLAGQLELLAQRVGADDASQATGVLSQNLQHLAKDVRDRPLARVRAGDTLQVNWELMRGRAFRDAAWWRHNVDDPVASIQPDPPRRARHSQALGIEATQVEVAVSKVETLADDGDGLTSSTDPSVSASRTGWPPEVRDWQVRIEHESTELTSSPPPPGKNPHVDSAYHHALEAVKSLRNGGSIADPSARRAYIEDARTHLAQARHHLESAGG